MRYVITQFPSLHMRVTEVDGGVRVCVRKKGGGGAESGRGGFLLAKIFFTFITHIVFLTEGI